MGSMFSSQSNNSPCVTGFGGGIRIMFHEGWVGIVYHRRRECGRVKTKGEGYMFKVGVST